MKMSWKSNTENLNGKLMENPNYLNLAILNTFSMVLKQSTMKQR